MEIKLIADEKKINGNGSAICAEWRKLICPKSPFISSGRRRVYGVVAQKSTLENLIHLWIVSDLKTQDVPSRDNFTVKKKQVTYRYFTSSSRGYTFPHQRVMNSSGWSTDEIDWSTGGSSRPVPASVGRPMSFARASRYRLSPEKKCPAVNENRFSVICSLSDGNMRIRIYLLNALGSQFLFLF